MATSPIYANGKKKWCVMLYLAADIDLEAAALADLEQMKAAGSSGQVDLLAQLNPGGSRLVRRYHLQKETYLEEDLVTDVGADGNEVFLRNVHARKDLIQFVEWCKRRSDAEHYALILWGHGQGWKADNPDPCFVPGAGNPEKSIEARALDIAAALGNAGSSIQLEAFPVTPANAESGFLSNTDLREALAVATKILGKKIDILGLDACLMAMAEICCQVDQSVNYLVACEDTVPDESWPYDSIMKLLVNHADRMTPEDFARIIVWKFVHDFGRKKKFVTQSICRLGNDNQQALHSFTSAVARLVDALRAEMNDPEMRWAMMIARTHVQSFYIKEYVDLYDFCRLLSINSPSKYVKQACEAVMEAIAGPPAVNGKGPVRKLVVDNGTYGYPLKRSFGVSIYFPCVGGVPPCYPSLEFCKKTNWHEFLRAFLNSPRGVAAREEIPVVAVGKSVPSGKPAPHAELAPAFAGAGGITFDANAAIPNGGVAHEAAAGSLNELTSMETATTNGGIKTTHNDTIKTTHGDVIKTTHGDPIKKPDLPVWLLPQRPILTAPIFPAPPAPPEREKEPVPEHSCCCGRKH